VASAPVPAGVAGAQALALVPVGAVAGAGALAPAGVQALDIADPAAGAYPQKAELVDIVDLGIPAGAAGASALAPAGAVHKPLPIEMTHLAVCYQMPFPVQSFQQLPEPAYESDP